MLDGSQEMFAYVFYANLVYAVVGGIGWVLIDEFVGIDTLVRSLCGFLLGSVILNLTFYNISMENFITLELFKPNDSSISFLVNLILHIVFLLSFLAAQVDKRRYRFRSEE